MGRADRDLHSICPGDAGFRHPQPPPPQLQALMNSVAAGCGLHLYIPN